MNVLITAGPTRERIDPVRFLSNRSTGKMGYALARAAIDAGNEVVLITGPTTLTPPETTTVVRVESATEMAAAVKDRAQRADVIIMAAAVADYAPAVIEPQKLKKTDGDLILRLKRTEDILAWLGEHKRDDQILVGFAAETENLIANAEKKLRNKNLDWIVANDVSASEGGFASDANAATLLGRNGEKIVFPLMSKRELAERIFRHVSFGEATLD